MKTTIHQQFAGRAARDFRRRGGFALIVTLSLMILLTVIAVGLLTLSSISLRRSGASAAMAEAEANARLGILLAIGELQKSVGRDQAITASSDIVGGTSGRTQLTGVWNSWDINPAQGAPKYEAEKAQRFQTWLVSNAKPTAVLDRDFVNQPAAKDDITLISAANKAAANEVRAGRVPVGKRGALAWQVSDESAKARINLVRDPSRNKTLAERRALVAGHRPGVRSQKTTDGLSLDFLPDDSQTASFDKTVALNSSLLDMAQADLLAGKPLPRDLRNDLTSHSLGVLADVRKGGLKRDLTNAFEDAAGLPAEWVGKKLYASTHGVGGVSDPNWLTLSGYYNSYKKARNLETLPSFKLDSADSVNIGSPVVPSKFTIAPVVSKIDVIFTVVVRDSHGPWPATLLSRTGDPQKKYMMHLVCVPIVTLYNPYNAEIEFERLNLLVRDVPVGFNFYVNDKPQNNRLVAYNDLFVNKGAPIAGAGGEKAFMLDLANWSSPGETTPRNTLKMRPGQTMVCSPYLDPSGTSALTLRNMVGTKDDFITSGAPPPSLKLRPGYNGKASGIGLDYLTPNRFDSGQSTDGMAEVLGLRRDDRVRVESAILRPERGVQDQWAVDATLWVSGRKYPYGGIQFIYQDQPTLDKQFSKRFMYPTSGNLLADDIYESYTKSLASQIRGRALFELSSAARTANGGVYETDKRDIMTGSLNTQLDGRLAGKPFLFHNPARAVNQINLKNDPPGRFTHELNFQPLVKGELDDVLAIDSTNRGPSLTGNTTFKGIKSGVLFELPTGPMQTLAGFRRSNVWNSPFLPDFVQPMANSAVTPLMSTTTAKQDGLATYPLLDHSYLANHALYDSCYFSTFAAQGNRPAETVFGDFLAGRAPLATQCFEPYRPSGTDSAAAVARLFKAGKPTPTAWKEAAAWQLVKGSFNVNSTSVLAWKAMLSSLAGTDIPVLWANNLGLESRPGGAAPITALTMPIGGLATDTNINPTKIDNQLTNEWNGYRSLDEDQLNKLASRIVEEVKARGPFLSMSEFVNRRLGSDSAQTRGGALHAAIESSGVNDPVFTRMIPVRSQDVSDAATYGYETPAAAVGSPAEGAPGWITQGDLLHILEPRATVRGDTFIIRACGQALDGQGKVVCKVYAEAVVQRVPEFIDPTNRAEAAESELTPANRLFGRRMDIVSFRWLSPKEI